MFYFHNVCVYDLGEDWNEIMHVPRPEEPEISRVRQMLTNSKAGSLSHSNRMSFGVKIPTPKNTPKKEAFS